MGRRYLVAIAIVCFAVSIIAFLLYRHLQPPPGVELKGEEGAVQWISLATSIVSLVTAVLTLAKLGMSIRRVGNGE
jgi:hypothetical protein